MFEKVNPMHPDKIADRIAGAIVDMAYVQENNPKIAVEVLIGHGKCFIVTETSCELEIADIVGTVHRIAGDDIYVEYLENKQDEHLANNQTEKIKCGDNGIFKGTPVTMEQWELVSLAHDMYDKYKSDGKYIIDKEKTPKFVICQSNADKSLYKEYGQKAIVNPIGDWTGGTSVDTGATNRKLGSDMGDSVTGGGLHGKDLSKADVSVNIYLWMKAQKTDKVETASCAIGDEYVDGKPYSEIVEIARDFIKRMGGFEKFAEWGMLR